MSNVGDPKSIMIYAGWDLVGDGILKLPMIRALRAAYPKAKITWVAGKRESAFATILSPLVDGLLDEVIEHAGIGGSVADLLFNTPLKGRRFDLIIDTQKVALASLSIWRIPHKHFISPFAKFRLSTVTPEPDYKWPRHIVRQLLDLADLATGGTSSVPERIALPVSDAEHTLAGQLLLDGPTYVAMAPGAGGRPKCWPLDYFIELGQIQAKAGRIPVYLLGPQEEEWMMRIEKAIPRARFPLQEDRRHGFASTFTVALGDRCKVAVVNDAGVGHMLASSKAGLISLFGPTKPEKFTPVTPKLTLLRAQNYGEGDAMEMISVPVVKDAVEAMLKR